MTFITALQDGRVGLHNSYHGPFNPSGTTLYVPVVAPGLRTLGMAKTTILNPGTNDWAQIGADVSISGASDVLSVYAAFDSGNTRIGVGTAQSNGDMRYHEFNTSTEAWDITDEVIRQVAASPDEYSVADTKPSVCIQLRDDGDVVCMHNGEESGGPGPFGLYAGIRTSSWGGLNKQTDSASRIRSIVSTHNGTSTQDFSSFLTGKGNAQARVSVNASATVRYDTIGFGVDTTDFHSGPGALNTITDQVYFPFVDENNDLSTVDWDGDDNAASITHNERVVGAIGNIAHHGATTPPYPPCGAVWDGTDVHVVYGKDSDKDIYQNDDGMTGGTDTEIRDGLNCQRLSIGISADTNSLLVLFAVPVSGVTTPKFFRHTIGVSAPAKNRQRGFFLQGLTRSPDLDPNPQPPNPTFDLPLVEGTVLWEQRWDQCVLSPLPLDPVTGEHWSATERGAVNFVDKDVVICADPGIIQNGRPSGTFETISDTELNANACRMIATQDQYDTDATGPTSGTKNPRNHTMIQLYSNSQGWESGHHFVQGEVYKYSTLIKLGQDFGLNNPQWTILAQLKSLQTNKISRNPNLAFSTSDSKYKIKYRGDSRDNLQSNEYEYQSDTFTIGSVIPDIWELFEFTFLNDPSDIGGGPTVGNAWATVKRNGVLKPLAGVSGVKIGFESILGDGITTGIYHNFHSGSIADSLEFIQGPCRLEKLS